MRIRRTDKVIDEYGVANSRRWNLKRVEEGTIKKIDRIDTRWSVGGEGKRVGGRQTEAGDDKLTIYWDSIIIRNKFLDVKKLYKYKVNKIDQWFIEKNHFWEFHIKVLVICI